MTRKTKKEVTYTYDKPLKIGSKGEVVKYMSIQLGKHGSTIKPTETYHIGMQSAVKAFQKRNKLKVTGVIDKRTWAKLAV